MNKQPRKPNILFFMPDQMRGDCLSLDRHPVLQTPNFDAIGHQGAHFRRAYSTCPSCVPARRALLTGQHPSTSGMICMAVGYPITAPTLPHVLRDGGYQTVLVGRTMHQSPESRRYGYEQMILGSTNVLDDEYARYLEREEPESGGWRGTGLSCNGPSARPWNLEEKHHPTNWITRQARGFLTRRDVTCPLFLTASYFAPHPPLMPPAFYMDRYLRTGVPDPAIGDWAAPPPADGLGLDPESPVVNLTGERLLSCRAAYYGLINHLDDQFYWLMREFQRMSADEGRPWLIVISSDHGEMLGDHYLFRKTLPYEGSARIPLLVQGSPELELAAGVVCDAPVCLEDIMPTLLEVAGCEVPGTVDGKSLLPVLRGEAPRVREVLFGEHGGLSRPNHYATDGRFKYIWLSRTGQEQLFDLANDPNECRDLVRDDEQAATLARWRNRMIGHLAGRPEGFVVDGALVAGRTHRRVLPQAAEIKGRYDEYGDTMFERQ